MGKILAIRLEAKETTMGNKSSQILPYPIVVDNA